MIKVGFKYKTQFDGGDIYEVINDDDRFKWVNISGLEHQIREHKYSKVS